MAAIRGLQPSDPPEWIRDRLLDEQRDILMVGHFPSLPRILHTLTADSLGSVGSPGGDDGRSEDFPLHGAVALASAGEQWAVQWRMENA